MIRRTGDCRSSVTLSPRGGAGEGEGDEGTTGLFGPKGRRSSRGGRRSSNTPLIRQLDCASEPPESMNGNET